VLLLGLCHQAHANDLLFCVITARRPATSYLSPLLEELTLQRAAFRVVDTDNSTLPSLKALKLARVTRCVEPSNVISCPVQKQALDVLDGLQLCLSSSPRWLVLLEDDMLPCAGAIETMALFLNSTLSAESAWRSFKTARFAKFPRAVVFPLENIQPYSDYVRAHLREAPYDSLLNSGGWAPAGSSDYIHASSLFSHAGKVSTIAERNDPAFVTTYAALRDEACS
jgi:hypothetical protein